MKPNSERFVCTGAQLMLFALVLIAQASPASSAPQDQPASELLTPAPTLAAPPNLIKPAAPASRENCGTVWTGWIDDPDADFNPCQQGCERGEQLSVKPHQSGDSKQYDVNYQCYMPETPTLSMPLDAPSSGENCGTFWTGWMDTLDTVVNPCPQGCVRGQQPTVKTGLSDHGIKYDVNYQCYTAMTTISPGARAPKPMADPAAAPQQVSSTPAGKLIPASGPWGEFVRVEGVHFGSTETVRGMWFPADDTTQPPGMTQTVTLRAHDGADAIEIQIPADPLISGWSGDFAKGALRLLLIMPDESVIYAGQYVIDSGDARTNLRRAVGADISTTSAAQQTPTASEREITPVPSALVTASLQMTGKRLAAIGTLSGREIAPAPVAVVTSTLQMTGKRLSTIGALSGRAIAPVPVALVTPALQMTGKRVTFIGTASDWAIAVVTSTLQMTGKRLSTIGALSEREIAPAPVAVVTPALQMTGKRLQAMPDRPTKVINQPPK